MFFDLINILISLLQYTRYTRYSDLTSVTDSGLPAVFKIIIQSAVSTVEVLRSVAK